jgi:hypothetical protein
VYLETICHLHSSPCRGRSNDISALAISLNLFSINSQYSGDHASVGPFASPPLQPQHRLLIRTYHLFTLQTSPSVGGGPKMFLLTTEGFRTKPSTTKHCCAMSRVEPSYANLSIHPLRSTMWILSSIALMMKPSMASRCDKTSTYPTSTLTSETVSTTLFRNTGLYLTRRESSSPSNNTNA